MVIEGFNEVQQNAHMNPIPLLVFSGSLIGDIILLPTEVVLGLTLKYYFRRK